MAVAEVDAEVAGAPHVAALRRLGGWLARAGALIAVIVVFGALKPDVFLTSDNATVVLSQTAVSALLAAGLSMSLMAGAFDLSFGAILAVTGVVGAKLLTSGLPWPIAVVIAVAMAGAIGAVNGLVVVRTHVPSLVATLGMQSVLVGIVAWMVGGAYVSLGPSAFVDFGRGAAILGIPNQTVVAAIVCVAGALAMRYLTIGRNLQAVGANPEASRLAGINVDGYVAGALALTGAFAGLAAMLVTAQLAAGHPEIGPGYLLPAFAAAFIGASVGRAGTFGFLGAFYGALLLTTLTNGLVIVNAPEWTQNVVTGVVLVAAVALSRALRARAAKG